MASTHAGHLPEEWWQHDKQEPRPRYSGDETVALFEMGELSEAEIAALMPTWREQFERSQEPDFSYCQGANRWLNGAPARRALYRWAGIPEPILVQLEAEARNS